MPRPRISVPVALTTALALLVSVLTGIALTSATASPQAQAAGGVKVAYFAQWGIYANAFYPKNMHTTGIAGKLDFLNYAFANIHPTTHTCFMANKAASQDENDPNAGDGAGDAYADYGKSYGADISVDGAGDTWDQPLAGNFNQLRKLKAQYPNLKILISIGGWTYSKYFSDASSTAAKRQSFVSSCIDMFLRGNLPTIDGRGGTGAAAGVFDGIDLDWEYPGSPNGHVGNHHSPADTQNFTLLLQEFRNQLDAYGNQTGKRYYLTAATPAGQDKIATIETNKIGQYLDLNNVMTYDMHGAWDAAGPTNFQDPLYDTPDDPSTPIPPGTAQYNIDGSVKAWTTGDPAYGIPGGFPANKLTIGYPFYYRGWRGVPDGGRSGLYQSATGGATGHPHSGNVAGVSFYKELLGFVDNPAYTHFDDTTKATWFYNGDTFWTGDNAQSIKAKADYAHCKGLAGAMMYSLEALDAGATLFNHVVDAVNANTPDCSNPNPTPSTPNPSTPNPSTPNPSTPNPSTPNPTPSQPPTGTAWTAWTSYSAGARVTYNGAEYQCIQPHTSQPGWEPPNVPALWRAL
jgi:chitinase